MQGGCILGLDPGSRVTGWGLITLEGKAWRCVASGSWSLDGSSFLERLQTLQQEVTSLLQQYKPAHIAIENVFMHKNAQSALKLGQARGILLGCALLHNYPIFEYAPRQVKQAIVGKGGATKDQVQRMVQILLKSESSMTLDESDALAIALTHAHVQSSPLILQKTTFARRKSSKRSTRWVTYDRKT